MSIVLKKNSGYVVTRKDIGEGTITNEDGSEETFKVSTYLNTQAPIIELESGNYVILSWEDIFTLAKDIEKKYCENKSEVTDNG